MDTEVWFRFPKFYVREADELGLYNFVWDRGTVAKWVISPDAYLEQFIAFNAEYRMLMVGEQGTAEVRRESSVAEPTAVYPTWFYGSPLDELENMMRTNIGDDEEACNDEYLLLEDRPVFGQEHRVVISGLPPMNTGMGRQIIRILSNYQEAFPNVIMMIHGLYGYSQLFGYEWRAVDIDPYNSASRGRVVLPMGKELTCEAAARFPQWVTLLGYLPIDLKVPRNRCMFNMESALWAAEHFREDIRFRTKPRKGETVDPNAITAVPATVVPSGRRAGTKTAKDGDKIACDVCSLATNCKSFRVGEVCSIKGSEGASLAALFQTRNSDKIIDGMVKVLEHSAERYERAADQEEDFGGPGVDGAALDPELTKLAKLIIEKGGQVAMLIDPALRPQAGRPPAVNVFAGKGAAVGVGGTPQAAVAAVVQELEANGFTRDQMTPEAIEAFLQSEPEAIEAHSTERS